MAVQVNIAFLGDGRDVFFEERENSAVALPRALEFVHVRNKVFGDFLPFVLDIRARPLVHHEQLGGVNSTTVRGIVQREPAPNREEIRRKKQAKKLTFGKWSTTHQPSLSLASRSAPWSSSNFTMSRLPNKEASIKGVVPR